MKYFFKRFILFFLISTASLAHAETQVYFSPNGGCQEAVITQINKAHQSIDIAMYEFTSREIAQALIEAQKRGISLRVSLDRLQIKDFNSKSRFLVSQGVKVRFHLGPGLMHNKFAVIDQRVVITGSFNWTHTADKKNAENLLIITDKRLAKKYEEQFEHLWSQSGEGGF